MAGLVHGQAVVLFVDDKNKVTDISSRHLKGYIKDRNVGSKTKEAKMITQDIPIGGLTTVGQIVGTNTVRFHPWCNGESVVLTLFSSHTAGAPVVDDEGQYLGFINEFDVMRVLAEKKDLTRLTAKDIMRQDRLTVSSQTNINDAVQLMETHTVVNLPVEENGVVAYSISWHDLLRAKLGIPRDRIGSAASSLMMRPPNRRIDNLIQNWVKETTRRKYGSKPRVSSNNVRAHFSRQIST